MPHRAKDAAADIEAGFAAARSRRLIFARIAGACLTALTASYWLGPVYPLIWLAGLAVFEIVTAKKLHRLVDQAASDDPTERAARIAHLCAGSVLYLAPCVATWLAAGSEFNLIGAFYLCCMFVHGALFRAGTPALAGIALGPPALVGVLMPLVVQTNPIVTLLTVLAAVQLTLVVLTSIGDRKRLIDRSVQYKTEAIDAERANVAKSQFLAVMSHELRTPLNAIINYAELLEEDLQEADRGANAQDAKEIASAGQSLLALINDILDLSKIEAGRLDIRSAPVNVGEIIRAAVDTCAPTAEANGNKVVVHVAANIGFIEADGLRLRQCVLNLVSNACKFTKNGAISVSATAQGDRLTIQVRDTGIGITEEQMARLFQPFVQADATITRAYGGSGLGLSITKRLCELMGGSVALRSKPGEGTTGTITLPLVTEEAEALAA